MQTGPAEPASPLSHGPPPLPLAAPGSGKPPVRVCRVRLGHLITSISSTPSGSSAGSYSQAPPGLTTVGGATTTPLLVLRHDK